jgi:hypothetical protein
LTAARLAAAIIVLLGTTATGSAQVQNHHFYLTALPAEVGPGGEVSLFSGLIGVPATAPPYGARLDIEGAGSVSFVLQPGVYNRYTWTLGQATTFSLLGVNPPDGTLALAVPVDPSLQAAVGIAAIGGRAPGAGRAPRYSAGDPFSIVQVIAAASSVTADVYSAIVLPSGTFFCFRAIDQGFDLGPANAVVPQAVTARLGNGWLRTLVAFEALPPVLPLGRYTLISAIGPAGGSILDDAFHLASSEFVIE